MFQTIQTVLRIRFLQLYRELKATGWFYSLLILCICGFFFNMGLKNSQNDNLCYILAGIQIIILLGLEQSRNDHSFLSILNAHAKTIITVEYFVLSIPVFLILCFSSLPILILPILLAIVIIVHLPRITIRSSSSTRAFRNIPIQLYEWRAGFRQNGKMLLIIYIIGILVTPFPYATLLFVWLTSAILCGFYQRTEPIDHLERSGNTGKQIIHNKIKIGLKWYSVIIAVPLVVYSIFHTDQIYITLSAFILFCIVFVFSILTKYAFYIPHENQGPSGFYQALSQISVMIPFLIPIPLVLSFVWYNRAIHHLNQHLYAPN